MNKLILLFSFFNFTLSYAQEQIRWKKDWEIPVKQDAVWRVDLLGNLFLAEKDELKKIDSLGVIQYKQSSKNVGEVDAIDPRNPMKILLFSSDQQFISYTDNTLSKQQENIELANFDLSYVTLVCASAQPDKIWVFDQDNSKVLLISANKQQMQRIENIGGLLGIQQLKQLIEQDNLLYLVDEKEGLFQFDMYGTLLFKWPFASVDYVGISGDFAYLLKDNQLELLNLRNASVINVTLPELGIFEFQKVQNHVYFRTSDKIIRYQLEIIQN